MFWYIHANEPQLPALPVSTAYVLSWSNMYYAVSQLNSLTPPALPLSIAYVLYKIGWYLKWMKPKKGLYAGCEIGDNRHRSVRLEQERMPMFNDDWFIAHTHSRLELNDNELCIWLSV